MQECRSRDCHEGAYGEGGKYWRKGSPFQREILSSCGKAGRVCRESEQTQTFLLEDPAAPCQREPHVWKTALAPGYCREA